MNKNVFLSRVLLKGKVLQKFKTDIAVVVIIPKSVTLLLQTLDVGADLHCAI